jgi:hypothetical protein
MSFEPLIKPISVSKSSLALSYWTYFAYNLRNLSSYSKLMRYLTKNLLLTSGSIFSCFLENEFGDCYATLAGLFISSNFVLITPCILLIRTINSLFVSINFLQSTLYVLFGYKLTLRYLPCCIVPVLTFQERLSQGHLSLRPDWTDFLCFVELGI